ncbi:hypothetical protein, partial [Neisseria gonorrhoeae]|uniref:hypothetical protein n=1 Tax=Neisseria gonorrhoeae TaxID=485 RepID=UPI001F4E24E5
RLIFDLRPKGWLRKLARRRESGPWNNGNIQRLSESPRFQIPAFAGMTKSGGNDGSGIPSCPDFC